MSASETNPYAPPAVSETENPSARYWRVDGTDVLARNRAALPKVDLDTGSADGDMRSVPLVCQALTPAVLVRMVLMVGVYLALVRFLDLTPLALMVVVFVTVFLSKLGVLPGGTGSQATVWRFMTESRFRAFRFRRRLRIGLMLGVFAMVAGSLFVPAFINSMLVLDFMDGWIYRIVPAGAVLVIGLGAWGAFDRSKARIRSEENGWFRIAPVHPEALAFLRSEERRELLEQAVGSPRMRRVRTLFLHRYPLRMLIGRRGWNPLYVLQCALMKFLRSRLLVREAWHFSEAEERTLENLNEPMRQSAGEWQAAHPDWRFVNAERLPSPAGDLIMESATFASPGLEHCLTISRAWLEQRPGGGITQYHFRTWLADGDDFSTHDQPYLALRNPHLVQRASGSPEAIYQKHLGGAAGLVPCPPADIAELRSRILRNKEETERLLTERGFQTETREVPA